MKWFEWACTFNHKTGQYNEQSLFNKGLFDEIFGIYSAPFIEIPLPKITDKQTDEILNCCWRVCENAISEKIKSNHEFVSMLFFNIIQNHYLVDGNKRTAVAICFICIVAIKLFKKEDIKIIDLVKVELLALEVAKGQYKGYKEICQTMKNLTEL